MTNLDNLYNELENHLKNGNFDIEDLNIYDYIGCCIDAIVAINTNKEDFEITYPDNDIKLPYEVVDDFDLFDFIKNGDNDGIINNDKNSLENYIFINCLENDEELTRLIKNYISMLTPMEIKDELLQYQNGQ